MPQNRKLAAIMFTDIVGYTALMGNDEQKAFAVLNQNRQLQKPIIEKYGGRWIKELGDGVMASFNTVSDAVTAAIEIQEECRKHNNFLLRIGIHHGEIVLEDDDVFGDAVNIASRIQAIAPVGGIYISEAVQHIVSNKADIKTKFIKAENFKNVKTPLRIYEVLLNDTALTPHDIGKRKNSFKNFKKYLNPTTIILVVSILIITSLLFYVNEKKSIFGSSSIESIAVLPFLNESGIADMDYLSDGMTETLINSLSQITALSVKARSSVFRYKDKNIDPQQAGNELSVQAVLNGRVAQREDNIILNLELVDVSSGNQIWGEQYNRKTNDLVSLQSEIAHDVAKKLHQKIAGSEGQNIAKNYTNDSEAYKLYLRGLFHWNKRTSEDLKKAIEYFNQAKEKDPSFALAYAGLAVTYSVLPNNSVMTKEEEGEMKLKAKASALKALELDDNVAEAYAVLAGEKVESWDFKGAENDFKKAIKLNPNFATARQWYSELLSIQERHSEAIAEVEKAIELDPFSPAVNFNVGIRYLQAGKQEESIKQLKKTLEIAPEYHMPYRFLSLIYFHEKKYKEALALASKVQVLMKIKTTESAEREEAELLRVIHSEGEKGYWKRTLKDNLEYYETGIGSPINVAISFAELGEKAKALEWLEKAYAERDSRLIYVKSELSFRSLHSDPQFKDLLQRVGLPL